MKKSVANGVCPTPKMPLLCSQATLCLHLCSLSSSCVTPLHKTLAALSSFSSPLLSSALARIHCVCTYYICGTPSFTSSARETRLLHSLALFTQTKSFSVSRTKPAKSLWLFHVLSAHSSPLSPGHWPGLWIQCAWGNRGRLKECASINLIMT